MATGDVITHDQLIEDGAFDPAQEGAKALNDIIGTLEDSFISFGTAAKEAIKWANPDNLTVEGYKKLTDQLDTMNTVTEQSVKTDKLKAQSLKALADQEKANTTILKQKAAQEKANTDAQAKSIVLTKEQIAQKQIDAAKDREAIALIKAKMAASNEALGTMQRIAAANAVLRNEQKNLNLTTVEGIARNGEINKQLDLNNGTIKKNADALKQQAMNVGNYSKDFTKSLRPLEELVRGLGYAMGLPIEGLREYTGVIRGATELNHKHAESIKGVAGATEEQTAAEAIQLDETGNVIAVKEADIVVTEEQAAVQEAAIPIIGWVIAGTVALAGIIAVAIAATEAHRKAIDDRSHAMDGSLIYDEKARQSYEDDIVAIDKVIDEFKVFMGTMSETQSVTDQTATVLKRKLNDISNDTKKNVDDAVGFWSVLKEAFGNTGLEAAQIQAQAEGNEKMYQAQQEAQNKLMELYKDNYNKMSDANQEYELSIIENQKNLSQAKNAFIRNDFARENKNDDAEKIALQKKLQNQLHYLDANHKADADYYFKRIKLITDADAAEEVISEKKKKRAEDYARELQSQILATKSQSAKLSLDKREGENADYEQQKNSLANSQAQRFNMNNLTPEQQTEVNKEKENLESTHQDNLLAIDRAAEDEWAALDKASNALIFNKYQRERAEAQQTYADNLKGYKRLLDDKLKYSKDPVYRANAIALYDVQVTQAGEVKDKANTITDNQEYAEGQKLRDESRKGFADEKVKADSLKNTSIPKALNDKLGALQSQNESDVDAENEKFAAEGGNDKASEDEKKAHYDKMILLDKNYIDDKTALKNAAFNKELDEAQKAEEALTNALAEGLAKRSEMQQASDQENIDTHSRLMGVQATLAAQGRANSLASETADMERAEEKKKQDAIRAAKQQEAIALSQSFLNLLVALTKKGDNNAAVTAMAETLAAKGLAAVIAGSALEGVEDTGTLGSGGLDGKGGRPWLLHDNERVLTKEQNAALGDISNDDLVNSFNNIYNHQFQSANSTSGKNVTFTSEITSQLIPKLEMVVRAIESQPRQSVSLGKIGEWHETVVKDSQKIIIHHLRNGGRSKL